MQLAAIIKCGGFTEAAAQLGTSQPALSRMVATLETRLGEPLFFHKRRPLQPTPVCVTLAEQGRTILAATNKAADSLDEFRKGEQGTIRLAGPPFFMDALVAGIIADFQALHPRVRVDQIHGYPAEVISMIRSAQADIALCPVDPLDQNNDLAFTPLIRAHNVLACRSDHPLSEKTTLAVEDILKYPWIAPPPNSPLNADLKNMLASMGIEKIRITYSCGSFGSVLNHLKRSDCLTALPHTVVFSLRDTNQIQALPMILSSPNRLFGLIQSEQMPSTPAIRLFANYLYDRFGKLKDQIQAS
ncbi:LysR family transcriptional regulator [Aliamphritea ceti]|uniref:LysR family transcriptional regulator n=1 Tax=Aliamphritea ceti TaxID=1524258 RepID=UPI0021C3CDCA|nr:LysR family transcriptional regulator [Aliamphritea ceti]